MDGFTVHHDGVTIPVSRCGRGRPLVLCPGLLTTRDDLRELAGLLRRDHDVVTFDLRGHGASSAGDRYTFEAFRGDLAAVLAEVRRRVPVAPVLVGHSLGADLIVHCAAERPDTAAGLVLVDGANPVPEPFLTEADLPEFRAMAAELAGRAALGAGEILALNVEMDRVRAGILDRYRRIDRPIGMVMSRSMAGDGGDGQTRWRNRNWRAGVERLVRARPGISVSWLDGGHDLPVSRAADIARIVGGISGTLERC